MQLKNFLLLLAITLVAAPAEAFSWREKLTFSFGGGLGDSSISKQVLVQDTFQDAKRSEAPGLVLLGVETTIRKNMTVGLRHTRGLKLSPFSTGVSFTGLYFNYYFLNPKPYLPPNTSKNSVTMMNWAPFVGVSSGLAVANTSREREVVANVSSSGFYMGINLGVDYHMYRRLILRPQIIYSTSLMDDTQHPATITEMGLMLSLIFRI